MLAFTLDEGSDSQVQVDPVTLDPSISPDANREPTFLHAAYFKELIHVSQALPETWRTTDRLQHTDQETDWVLRGRSGRIAQGGPSRCPQVRWSANVRPNEHPMEPTW